VLLKDRIFITAPENPFKDLLRPPAKLDRTPTQDEFVTQRAVTVAWHLSQSPVSVWQYLSCGQLTTQLGQQYSRQYLSTNYKQQYFDQKQGSYT